MSNNNFEKACINFNNKISTQMMVREVRNGIVVKRLLEEGECFLDSREFSVTESDLSVITWGKEYNIPRDSRSLKFAVRKSKKKKRERTAA